MRRRELDEDELQVLRLLAETAKKGAGWRRAGVRGWLLGAEVNDRAHSAASYNLQALRRHGLARGEPVPDPGRSNPVVLWRITSQGEQELALRERRLPGRIAEPREDPRDEGMIFLSPSAWDCLSVLQDSSGPVRWGAIVDAVGKRFRRGLYKEDAVLLLRRGLVTEEAQGSGTARERILTATPLGRTVQLLDRKTSETVLQLRMGGGG